MAESSFGGQEDTQVCEQCKQKVDASAPLRPLGLADLHRSLGETTQEFAAGFCRMRMDGVEEPRKDETYLFVVF
jgi:hypothetical protein